MNSSTGFTFNAFATAPNSIPSQRRSPEKTGSQTGGDRRERPPRQKSEVRPGQDDLRLFLSFPDDRIHTFDPNRPSLDANHTLAAV